MFKEMLKTPNSCASKTLIDAMVNFGMARTEEEAVKIRNNSPGEDLADIESCVTAGLKKISELLNCSFEELLLENLNELEKISKITPDELIEILDAIHLKWIEDNFNCKKVVEKFFKGQLFQYQKTAKIPFDELLKDLLFIQEYFIKVGYHVDIFELEYAFNMYASKNSTDDDINEKVENIKSFAPSIKAEVENYKNKLLSSSNDSKENNILIERVNNFIQGTENDPQKMIDRIVIHFLNS